MTSPLDLDAIARRADAIQHERDQREVARRERQRERLRARRTASKSDRVAQDAIQAESERLASLAFPWHLLDEPTRQLLTETRNRKGESVRRTLSLRWAMCCIFGIQFDDSKESCPFPSDLAMIKPVIEHLVHEVLIEWPYLDSDVLRQDMRESAEREMEKRRDRIAELRQQGQDIIGIGEGWFAFPSDEETPLEN